MQGLASCNTRSGGIGRGSSSVGHAMRAVLTHADHLRSRRAVLMESGLRTPYIKMAAGAAERSGGRHASSRAGSGPAQLRSGMNQLQGHCSYTGCGGH